MYKKETATIKMTSQVCIWSAVGLVIAAGLFVWLAPWTFHQNGEVSNGLLVAGSILSVAAISMALLTIRKRIPELRQGDSLGEKLKGYTTHIRSFYRSLLAVVAALCVMTVLSGQYTLLMLAIVTTMMLFLANPNIYKMKVDLGLSEEEMQLLFGNEYLGGDEF